MARPLGRRFQHLFAASALGHLGDGVVLVGMALVAVDLTRSAALVSGLTVAAFLPWTLFGLHAGVFADRMDRKRLMTAASWVRAMTLVTLGAVTIAGALSLPVLYAALVVLGTAEVVFENSAQALVPMLVDRERLSAANGRIVAAQSVGSNFVGAPLAAVLAGLATAWLFFGPAALYAIAGLLLWRLPGAYRAARPRASRIGADIAEGLRYLRRQRLLLGLAVGAALSNLASTAAFSVFVLYVVGPSSPMRLDDAAYGALIATVAAGGLSASLVAERLERRFGAARLVVAESLLSALTFVVPAVTTAFAPVAVAMFVAGATVMTVNIVITSLRQRIVPDHLLGRVVAAFRLVGMGTLPLGAVLGGAVGDVVGVQAVFALAAVICLAALAVVARTVTRRALQEAEEGAPV